TATKVARPVHGGEGCDSSAPWLATRNPRGKRLHCPAARVPTRQGADAGEQVGKVGSRLPNYARQSARGGRRLGLSARLRLGAKERKRTRSCRAQCPNEGGRERALCRAQHGA